MKFKEFDSRELRSHEQVGGGGSGDANDALARDRAHLEALMSAGDEIRRSVTPHDSEQYLVAQVQDTGQ